jgi:ribosomal-protein-alanine N-acetyltransferase
MAFLASLLPISVPHTRLVGNRVVVRSPAYADWAAWSTLRAQSRSFLTPWEPSWPADMLSRASYRRRLIRYALDWRDQVGYSFFISRREDDELLGGIALSNIRRGVAETVSLGYWIGQPHARQGYMSEAIRLVLRFSFEKLGLHRVEAACLPANMASRSLLMKAGFREEGYAKQYLFIDGAWRDHVLYAMLRDEWPARGDPSR